VIPLATNLINQGTILIKNFYILPLKPQALLTLASVFTDEEGGLQAPVTLIKWYREQSSCTSW